MMVDTILAPLRRAARAAARLPMPMLALGLLLSACDPVSRTVDYDRAADFSAYSTYAWTFDEAGRGAAGAPPLNPLIGQRVQDAIQRTLAAKGFVEGFPADFTVAYSVGIRDRAFTSFLPEFEPVLVPGLGIQYIRTASRPVTYRYQEGTIAVDVFDVATGRPVWHGSATKEVDPDDATPEAINAIVQSLMADFPPPAGAPIRPRF